MLPQLKDHKLIHQLIDTMRQNVLAEEASLLLYDNTDNALVFMASASPVREQLISKRVSLAHGIVSFVYSFQQPTIVNDVKTDERHDTVIDESVGTSTKQMMVVPVSNTNYEYGVLTSINCGHEKGFRPEHLDIALQCAGQLSSELCEMGVIIDD